MQQESVSKKKKSKHFSTCPSESRKHCLEYQVLTLPNNTEVSNHRMVGKEEEAKKKKKL